jgi:osmotically-inducible protein OsmY
VEAAGVDVRIENGQVLLLGSVPSFTARRAVEMNALRIPGVKSVENRLWVDPDPGLPTGDAVARRIRMILDWSPEVDDAGEIEVRIAEGRVTLTGSVDALWKKERIGELASIPAGVLRVYNNITVLPGERVADEAIAGRILRAIARTAGGAAGRVSVTVRNGKVVLSGQVPSWAACQLVLEAALYTGGVVDVENGLQVR